MSGQQNRSARGAIFGGLAGGIFFFGLAIAVTTGQFLPVLFATLALSSLVGSTFPHPMRRASMVAFRDLSF